MPTNGELAMDSADIRSIALHAAMDLRRGHTCDAQVLLDEARKIEAYLHGPQAQVVPSDAANIGFGQQEKQATGGN